MSEKLTEQQTQVQLQQVESFYNAVINDLKGQITNLVEQKAVQFAQNQQFVQSLKNQINELEQKISELSGE